MANCDLLFRHIRPDQCLILVPIVERHRRFQLVDQWVVFVGDEIVLANGGTVRE